jgi:hypothetical protein
LFLESSGGGLRQKLAALYAQDERVVIEVVTNA